LIDYLVLLFLHIVCIWIGFQFCSFSYCSFICLHRTYIQNLMIIVSICSWKPIIKRLHLMQLSNTKKKRTYELIKCTYVDNWYSFIISYSLKKKKNFKCHTQVKLLVWLCPWVYSGSNVFYILSRRSSRCHIQPTCYSLVIVMLPTSPAVGPQWLRSTCLISFIAYGNLSTWVFLSRFTIKTNLDMCILLNPNELFQ